MLITASFPIVFTFYSPFAVTGVWGLIRSSSQARLARIFKTKRKLSVVASGLTFNYNTTTL